MGCTSSNMAKSPAAQQQTSAPAPAEPSQIRAPSELLQAPTSPPLEETKADVLPSVIEEETRDSEVTVDPAPAASPQAQDGSIASTHKTVHTQSDLSQQIPPRSETGATSLSVGASQRVAASAQSTTSTTSSSSSYRLSKHFAANRQILQSELPLLLGSELPRTDGSCVQLRELLQKGKFFGLLFAAEWCEPAALFTEVLGGWYQKFKKDHPRSQDLEILYVSQDDTEETYTRFTGSMPNWLVLPFDLERNVDISRQLDVLKLPSLLFFDAWTGKVVVLDGVEQIESDPDALAPWLI